MSTPRHPFRFVAVFVDETIIEQNDTDTSATDPTRSAFFDVQEYAKTNKLLKFGLYNPATQDAYSLSLMDGHFEINNLPFTLHPRDVQPELHDLRIIYFARTKVWRTAMVHTGELTDTGHEIIGYDLGWQTTINDQNQQYVIHLPV